MASNSTRPKNRLLELLTRPMNFPFIQFPNWLWLVLVVVFFSFVFLRTANQHAELRDEWASPDRPEIVTLQSMKVLLALEKDVSAELDIVSIYEKIAELTRLHKEDSPSKAAILNQLASLYAAQGEYEKAIPMFDESKNLLTKYLGAAHEDVVTIDDNLRSAHADKQTSENVNSSAGHNNLKAAPQE